MTKYKIILQPSDIMEKNKRETESSFIRMRQSLRRKIKMECDDRVALFRTSDSPSATLAVRQAYREDIINHPDENVCFVTERNFKFYGSHKDFKISLYDMFDFITMGADPEFVLVSPDTNAQINASSFCCDGFGTHSLFGCDGAGGPAELRPNPSSDITQLCNNLIEALRYGEKYSSVKKLRWSPGAYYSGLALGGHIHIGYAPQIGEVLQDKNGLRILVQILDHYLGTALVNIDGTNAITRKTIHDYGRAGNFRTQGNRFEWRVPSGMWLCDKKYAEGILGLSKLIAVKYYKEAQKLSTITQEHLKTIRKDIFNVAETDLRENAKCIDSHVKLPKKELETRLNKLSDLLQEDYFLGLLDGILKIPLIDLQRKESEDLRSIWY